MLSAALKFALASLLLDVLGVCGFAIHGKSNDGFQSDLSDALRLLERQRRQLNTGYYRNENDELPSLAYYGERLPYPYDDADIPSMGGYDNTDPERQISLEDLYRTLKSEKANNEKETTSDEELQEIFDTGDNENNSDNASESAETKETDSKLIEQASKLVPPPAVDGSLNAGPTEEEPENKNIKPVSKEQLDTLFENVDNDPENESGTQISELDTNDAEAEEEEPKTEELEFLKNYLQQSGSAGKRMTKRGSPRDRILQEKDEQIEALKEEVARLAIKEKLENAEIDALADALDKVTRGEITGTDDVQGEFSDLERAIRIEETLNSLSEIESGEALSNTDVTREDGDSTDNIEVADNIKRGEPDYKKKSVDDVDPSSEDTPAEKWFDDAPKTIPDIPNFIANYQDNDESEEPLIQMAADRDTESPLDDNVITPGELRAAISELEPWEKVELAKELSEIQQEDEEQRPPLGGPVYQCPDMNRLTSNCEFADENGIFMDEEARELCNRHEMCYACGASFQISVYKCDAGYLGDAVEACEGAVRCVSKAEQFLSEMRTRHVYSPRDEPYCTDRCIKDFIFGVA